MIKKTGRFAPVLLIPSTLMIMLLVIMTQTTSALNGDMDRRERIGPSEEPGVNVIQVETHQAHLPMVWRALPFSVDLEQAWTTNANDTSQVGFHPDSSIRYWASGVNNLDQPETVTLKWTQDDLCNGGDRTLIYSDTVHLDPGDWKLVFSASTPACGGLFSPHAEIIHERASQVEITEFAVNGPSRVIVSQDQGFDKCGLPRVDQMETWWKHSPYRVFNLYLGGSVFGCKSNPLDAVWVRKAADQGWDFIQTWVGPQAPCSSYADKISYDQDTAYQQGRQEARAAAEAAYDLGFFGDRIIYYDLEAYGDDTSSCHKAVVSFLSGWSKELHARGFRSGGYGASCASFMEEWTKVNPQLDDVWIANWYTDYYDPDATVWYTACLSNSLWDDNQRLRQYTGGHSETWGGEAITIDSNVLNGHITTLGREVPEASTGDQAVITRVYGTQIDDLGLFAPGEGWILSEGHLLVTRDEGSSWRDITPAGIGIMGASFPGSRDVWLVGWDPDGKHLAVLQSADGGETWQTSTLPLDAADTMMIADADVEALDTETAWVSLRLYSGSSFSVGRLFFTDDGGAGWVERTIPVGEAVNFDDRLNGWTAGGASGEEFYRTHDGGLSWQSEEMRIGADEEAVEMSARLPRGSVVSDFTGSLYGWAAVHEGTCLGDKNTAGSPLQCEQIWRLMVTEDGGAGWHRIELNPWGSLPSE